MKTVMLIGDSHSKITFPMIENLLNKNGYNVIDSVSNVGWATYSYTEKPNTLSYGLSLNPDIIVVALGGNNHYTNNKYKEKVQDFLNLIGYQNKKVVWISPYFATRQDVQDRHLWTHNWLKNNLPQSVSYIDVMQYRFPIANDGVHYPKSSYEKFVNSISNELLKSLKGFNAILLSSILISIGILFI